MHCDGSSPLFVAKVSQDIVAATQPFASTSASQLSERPTHSFLCWMHFVVVQNITGTAYLTCKGRKTKFWVTAFGGVLPRQWRQVCKKMSMNASASRRCH
jgi:hypothetical protein